MPGLSLNPRMNRTHPLIWVFESLEDDPRYVHKKLFNMETAYLDGLLYLGVVNGQEPWNGLVACTSYDRHAALLSEFPQLSSHKVLGKWLYISQNHPEFEAVALRLANAARARDPRLGVEPKPRRRPAARQKKAEIG